MAVLGGPGHTTTEDFPSTHSFGAATGTRCEQGLARRVASQAARSRRPIKLGRASNSSEGRSSSPAVQSLVRKGMSLGMQFPMPEGANQGVQAHARVGTTQFQQGQVLKPGNQCTTGHRAVRNCPCMQGFAGEVSSLSGWGPVLTK